MNYDRVFGDDHRVSALVYYYMSDEKTASSGTTNMNSIPMRYQGLSSRITYVSRDTYMIDFNFGYTGSENFQPGRRFDSSLGGLSDGSPRSMNSCAAAFLS